jgi:2-methylcitrate dehydratase PrpD
VEKIKEIVEWIEEISFSKIPESIIEKAKYQILSVFASLYSGINSKGGKIILKTIKQQKTPGNCSIIPDGEKTSIYNAVIANSSFSISYDFDDYIFMGHPSHSAVLVPIAFAEEFNLSGKEILVSQILANEIAGRFGAACVIGPHNGQAWSFLHLISSASAGAKLIKLKKNQIENAIAISLYQPPYVLFPGFIEGETKLLTAGISAAIGIFSCFLARNGFSGSKKIIEHPQGFLENFSFIPNEIFLSGFGKKWFLETIGYKLYPGCAYLSSPIEGLLEIMKDFKREKKRKLKTSDVKEIIVESTILTTGMDFLTKDRINSEKLTSLLVNFSVPLSIAVTIISGRITPDELKENFLEKHKKEILNLSKKVKVVHAPSLTLNLLKEFEKAGLFKIFLNNLNLKKIIPIFENFKKGVGYGLNFNSRDFIYFFELFLKDINLIKSLGESIIFKKSWGLENVDFKNLKMPFSARVKLFTYDGSVFEKYIEVPSGAKFSEDKMPEVFENVVNKFRQEAEKCIGRKRVNTIIEMVKKFENLKNLDEFVRICCFEK